MIFIKGTGIVVLHDPQLKEHTLETLIRLDISKITLFFFCFLVFNNFSNQFSETKT